MLYGYIYVGRILYTMAKFFRLNKFHLTEGESFIMFINNIKKEIQKIPKASNLFLIRFVQNLRNVLYRLRQLREILHKRMSEKKKYQKK